MSYQNIEDRENERQGSLRKLLIKEMPRIHRSLSSRGKKDFLNTIEQQEKDRSSFISSYRKIPLGCESFFVVLRKWNSYTPSLPGTDKTFKNVNQYSIGGGYFLFIQGKENTLDPGYGLVIDPGYNFIHNFGLAGFCLDDIDGILITHAHNDHTNDFESLLSLLYQRNSKFLGKRKPRKIDLFLNVGSFKKFSNYLDLANTKNEKNYIGKVTVMSPGQIHGLHNKDNIDFQIFTLYTNHHEIVTADYALGICFRLSDRIILMTGDTGWKYETALNNTNFLIGNSCIKEGEKIDVLVPHIGSIKRYEFDINNTGIDIESNYYDTHLGILGTISSIERWKPELCIISEFGEELTGLREKLVRELEVTCKSLSKDTYFVPGDIGLFILLDRKQTICYLNNELVDWKKIDYADIETAVQHSIKYISKKGLLGLSGRIRNRTLKKIEIKDSLSKFKACYYKELIKTFKIREKLNKAMGLIDEIASFEANMDSQDPSEIEECEMKVIGMIMALSCLENDPEKLISALANGWSSVHVVDTLERYHFYVSPCILDFSLRVYGIGYGKFNDPGDIQYQKNMRANVDSFLKKYKEILVYYEKQDRVKLKVAEEELKDILEQIR
jgi:hypothetical protein